MLARSESIFFLLLECHHPFAELLTQRRYCGGNTSVDCLCRDSDFPPHSGAAGRRCQPRPPTPTAGPASGDGLDPLCDTPVRGRFGVRKGTNPVGDRKPISRSVLNYRFVSHFVSLRVIFINYCFIERL